MGTNTDGVLKQSHLHYIFNIIRISNIQRVGVGSKKIIHHNTKVNVGYLYSLL